MRPKIIIISFTVIIGTVLSFYIVGQESKGTYEIGSKFTQNPGNFQREINGNRFSKENTIFNFH